MRDISHIPGVEQQLDLKDGRTIFKTHNGFRSFLMGKPNKNGAPVPVEPVTDKYYNQVKVHAINLKTR